MAKAGPPLSDQQVTALIAQFAAGPEEGSAQQIVDQLKQVGSRAINQLLTRLEAPDPDQRRVSVTLLPQLANSRAIRKMRKLVADRRLEDEHRLDILDVLRELKVEIDTDDLMNSLRDPSLFRDRMLDSILDRFDSEFELALVVDMLDKDVPPEPLIMYLTDAARVGGKRAVPLLQCFLWSEEEEVALAAMGILGMIGDPAPINSLGAIMKYGRSETLRSEARRILGRLMMSAEVPDQGQPPDHPFPLVDTLVTTIDGSGTQMMFVTRILPDESLGMTNFMFNDHEGLKDCYAGAMEPEMFEDVLDRLQLSGTEAIEISLGRCREIVAAARELALESGRGLPLAYEALASVLTGVDPREIEETPLPEINIHQNREPLDRSAELLQLGMFDSWFFDPQDWPAHTDAVTALEKLKGKKAATEMERQISAGIEAIMDDEFRHLLRDRLLRQAWLLAQLYDDEGEAAGWAVAAAQGLADDAPSVLTDHPVLREMMRETLSLPAGYSAQADADDDLIDPFWLDDLQGFDDDEESDW